MLPHGVCWLTRFSWAFAIAVAIFDCDWAAAVWLGSGAGGALGLDFTRSPFDPSAFVSQHAVDHAVVICKTLADGSFQHETKSLEESANGRHGLPGIGCQALHFQLQKRISKERVESLPRGPARRRGCHRNPHTVAAVLVINQAGDQSRIIRESNSRELFEAAIGMRSSGTHPLGHHAVLPIDDLHSCAPTSKT